MRDASREISQGVVQDLLDQKSAAEAFAGALAKVGDKLLNLAFDNLFAQNGPLTGGGGVAGGIGSFLGSLFGGARANGGPVSAGRAYVVDERRPELFVPGQSGRIIPSIPKATAARAGSMGVDVRVSVDVDGSGNITPFVTSVSQREIARDRPNTVRQSTQAVGKLNRASRHYLA